MIFVDYVGPAPRLDEVQTVVKQVVSSALRLPEEQVVIRRIVTESGRSAIGPANDVEVWIELSSEEQIYRVGQEIADGISTHLRSEDGAADVWVMYRLVPLRHAFLNGAPRARGGSSFD